MSEKKVSIILATTSCGGIGINNDIPWHIPDDLRYFKRITTFVTDKNKKNALIMGRNTWESLKSKPLQNRLNIILTSNIDYEINENFKKDTIIAYNIEEALMYCNSDNIESIFIIGGEQIYNIFFSNKYAKYIDKIYLSIITKKYDCNKFVDLNNIFKNYKILPENINIYDDYTSIIASNNTL